MQVIDKRMDTREPLMFSLPLELRQQIYDYLIPRETVAHPIPGVGVTSVSHRPPSKLLLSIHPRLSQELLDHFYTISTWRLRLDHAFNYFRPDPELRKLELSHSLNRIQKVEMVFFCDQQLLRDYPSFGFDMFCSEIRRRAARACQVLSQAAKLRTVVISWVDTTTTGAWAEKSSIITPLLDLSNASIAQGRSLKFVIGDIRGSEDVNLEVFVHFLQGMVGDTSIVVIDENGARV